MWAAKGTGLRSWTRQPAVAGQFYPGDRERLATGVDRYLAQARTALADVEPRAPADAPVVGIVVPHAGHVYSGPTAGFGYASLDPGRVRRVVLLGPAHYVGLDGIGTSTATGWRTPLGEVACDAEVAGELAATFGSVRPGDAAHGPEHSLEVQVPFLQRVLAPGWRLVPLIVGADLTAEVAELIAWCARLPQTAVVVSTDLSHYRDYETARSQDSHTIAAILARRADLIGPHDACGRYPLRGLLAAAAAAGWSIDLLDARNSGDTAGDRDRVVGYAAFVVRSTPPDAQAGAPGRAEVPEPAEPTESVSAVASAQGSGPAAQSRSAPGAVGSGALDEASAELLLRLARQVIVDALGTGRRPRTRAADWPEPLRRPGAAFVTLRSGQGDLLGCIGSLSAHQPLVVDVAEHAYDAAFRDPRFPPMTAARARDLVIDISVLSEPVEFPCSGYDDLLARVPVGSGVVVTAGGHRGTFLPAVWEQLSDPAQFLAALWRKAGLAPGRWPPGIGVEVYACQEFAEPVAHSR